MSLASLIREQMVPVVKCKTCAVLAKLPEQDRAEFEEARQNPKVTASMLGRAMSARLVELGIDDSLSESSVRAHIKDGHQS